MITPLFCMHAQMTIGEKTFDRCVQAAAAAGIGFHIHAAEGIADVNDALSKYGMRAVERLHKHGVLSEKSIAVHCVHITPAETDILAESGAA